MSIRARLVAWFTLSALALVVVGSLLFVSRLQKGLLDGVDARLSQRAEEIEPLLGDDVARWPRFLSSANGIYAQALDRSGRVVRSSRGLTEAAMLGAGEVSSALHSPRSSDATIAVRTAGGIEQQDMRLLAVHLPGTSDVLVLATSEQDVDEASRRATLQLAVLSAVVIAVALGGGWLLIRAALRPVERMRREVAALAADRISQGIPVPRTRDEIARLGHTFNGLLRRVRLAAERERAFVSDAGHELRTPLAVLKGELELAQNPRRTAEELRETVAIAAEETDRLIALAEDLLFLARGDESPALLLADVDLAQVIDQSVRALAAIARARGVRVSVDGPPTLVVRAERDRIRRVVDNVLVNALRHTPGGGSVRVTCAAHLGNAVITVADTGPGFPPEFLPHAFDRFTRVRTGAGDPADVDDPAQHGTGLGLAIVRSVLAAHGGSATAENGPDGGAVLTLRLPQDPSATD